MTTAVARIGSALHIDQVWAWVLCGVGLVAFALVVAVATYLHALLVVVALALVGMMTVLCFRWPIVGLCVFAALIPIEGVVLIDGVGTLSRLAGIVFALTYGLPRLSRLTLAPMPIAGWGFLAWAFISIGWAIDAYVTGVQLLTLAQLFLIAVLIADYVVRRPEIVRPILWAYSVSASAAAIIGFQSYLGIGVRSAALENQDPNVFAALLVPALMFGLHEFISGRLRIPGALVAFVTTLGVIVSGSRGAWLAGAVAIIIFLLPKLSLRQRLTAAASTAGIAAVLFQVPGIADLVGDRLGNALETGGAGRLDIWNVAQTIYASHPVFGVGFANFPVSYTSEAVRAAGVEFYTYAGRAPHNIAVGTLVELGPVGLVLLGLFLAPLVLRRAFGPYGIPVQAGLSALLMLAFFVDLIANNKAVWLMLGLAAGLIYADRQGGSAAAAAPGMESSGTDILPSESVPHNRRVRAHGSRRRPRGQRTVNMRSKADS